MRYVIFDSKALGNTVNEIQKTIQLTTCRPVIYKKHMGVQFM